MYSCLTVAIDHVEIKTWGGRIRKPQLFFLLNIIET